MSMEYKIIVKHGVVFKEINEYTLMFLQALRDCAKRFGYCYVITSANDGAHCKESYHYKNLAWDVRLKDLSPSHWYVLKSALKVALPEYFDIIVENVDDPDRVHLHAECDGTKLANWFMDHAEGAS